MYCINCLNFKTRVINKKTMKDQEFFNTLKIKNRIKKDGNVRVFYCLWQGLYSKVFISKYTETEFEKMNEITFKRQNRYLKIGEREITLPKLASPNCKLGIFDEN